MNRAQKIVRNLLEIDFGDHAERPGGPRDPMRQAGVEVNPDTFDYSGKREDKPPVTSAVNDMRGDADIQYDVGTIMSSSMPDRQKRQMLRDLFILNFKNRMPGMDDSVAEAVADELIDDVFAQHRPPSRFNIHFGESLNEVKRVIKRPRTEYDNVCPHCNETIHEKGTYSESLEAPLRHSTCGGAIAFEPIDPATVAPWLRQFLKIP